MAGDDFGGRPATANPPGDDRAHHSVLLSDPIAALIERLERAAVTCGPLALGTRAAVMVRRVSGGYVILRTPGW